MPIPFFNGRLNGTVEYYNTHTKDLLVKRSLNASLGYTTMLDNLGKTKSSGIDLSLNGDVVRTKEFTIFIERIVNTDNFILIHAEISSECPGKFFHTYHITI